MRKFLALGLLMALFIGTASAALFESGTKDAQPMVLYGKYNNTIVPVKVAADGTVGAGVASATYTVCASNAKNPQGCNYNADGTADEVEINQALVAADTYNGIVKLSEGQFNIAASILIPSDTTLDAGNATIFLSNGANTNMVKNYNHPNADSNIRLTGGTWNGNGANQSSPTISLTVGNFAIWMKNVTNLVIDNVYVLEPGGWSTNIQRCTDVRISNIRFYNTATHANQDGIHILDSKRVTVTNIVGTTTDDFLAVDAEELTTEQISISNATGTGNHASIALINDYFSVGANVYLQDINFNNISLSQSGTRGIIITGNFTPSSGYIRRISINGLKALTTNFANNSIFNIGALGMIDSSISNFNILDDGNAYVMNGGTFANSSFSNGTIRGVKNGFILGSGATPLSFNNISMVSTKPALASTSYGIGMATGATNGTTRISNVHIEGFGTAINSQGATSVTNAHFRGNRLGISHTDATYSMGLSNITYDTNDTNYTLTGLMGNFTGANLVVDLPAAQTIAATNTIAADACGSLKLITAAGAVTTSTTDTFTAPAAGNKGCIMHVCNTGANNITLDNNANFKSAGGADVVMTQDDCVTVGSTGASGVWYQLSPIIAN